MGDPPIGPPHVLNESGRGRERQGTATGSAAKKLEERKKRKKKKEKTNEETYKLAVVCVHTYMVYKPCM